MIETDAQGRVPGVYAGLVEDEYHSGPEVSVSGLKLFSEAGGPAKYRFGKRKETRALALGSLFHTATLEPEQLSRRYHPVNLPQLRKDTKAYQAEEVKALGREIIRQADYDDARRFADAVMRHPVAREILGPGAEVETSMFWNDPATGLRCRGRADIIRRDMRVLADVKSTTDASPDGFSWSAFEYRYHWQHQFYFEGAEAAGLFRPEAFIFFAIEKVEPYLIGAYELEPAAIELAETELRLALANMAKCRETGIWPGLSLTLETLSLPTRAYR